MFRIFRFKLIQFFLLLLLSASGSSLAATDPKPVILVFGDSLSAAYGIPREQGWVALLQQQLDQQPAKRQVINASISGETTSGGLTRLKLLLQRHQPEMVIIQLGANDGLRGLPVSDMRRNLAAMIEQSQQAGARVALIGILIPPNYGPRYTQEFKETYQLLAKQYKLPLVPFLLDGVTEKPELMQEDGLHPKANAQTIILDNVWRVLAPHFKAVTASK
jgi:acyl-CoA thioesterase-1